MVKFLECPEFDDTSILTEKKFGFFLTATFGLVMTNWISGNSDMSEVKLKRGAPDGL